MKLAFSSKLNLMHRSFSEFKGAPKTIALDADGVLLDYNLAYADVWAKVFGVRPALKRPNAYSALQRYDLPTLEGAELARLREGFGEEFWESVPALPGVAEAAHRLVEAGYRLVCVSALPVEFAPARQRNFDSLGIPISSTIATPKLVTHKDVSPKAAVINAIRPHAFVDDFAPFLQGVDPTVTHNALIMRETEGSPNYGPVRGLAHTEHQDFPSFVAWWLERR